MTDKTWLRQNYRQVRRTIADRQALDRSIFLRLLTFLRTKQFDSIFVYQSFDGEVDTTAVIEHFRTSKTLCVPKIINGNMILCHIDHPDQNMPECDITIVPLIAFDDQRYRLGFGGGYYDRYLSKAKTLSIGLAFDQQLCINLPRESHDQQLDMIITPSTVYEDKL